jgi:hypothetical protein
MSMLNAKRQKSASAERVGVSTSEMFKVRRPRYL